MLKKEGVYDPTKLFGVTTLDVLRSNTFVSENQGMDPTTTKVTVVGGHAGTTIVPLLSQVAGASFSDADRDALTQRIMFGGDEVVKAKAGGGSATLSMAVAGAQFADRVMRAKSGEEGIVECAYVQSEVMPGCAFFSSPITLGKDGVQEIHGVGEVTEYEQGGFPCAVILLVLLGLLRAFCWFVVWIRIICVSSPALTPHAPFPPRRPARRHAPRAHQAGGEGC